MGRMKDWVIQLEERMSEADEQEIIEEKRRFDEYIESCIEADKMKKRGVKL
jgi:hypothetical protein